MITNGDIIRVITDYAPPRLQEPYDNTGVQVGSVGRVHCFLHPQVMELPSLHEALEGRVNQPGLLLPAFMCLPSAHTASSPRPPPLCLVLKVEV